MILINGGSFFAGGRVDTPWFKRVSFSKAINLSRFTSSNERIFRTTLAYILEEKAPELVIIEWTIPCRYEVFHNNTYHPVSFPFSVDIKNDKYTVEPQPTVFSDKVNWSPDFTAPIKDVISSLNYVYSLKVILESKSIPYLFYFWNKTFFEKVDLNKPLYELSHWDRKASRPIVSYSQTVKRNTWYSSIPELKQPDIRTRILNANIALDPTGLPGENGHEFFAGIIKEEMNYARN